MSFFTLFKSKSTRELEAKIRFRRGKTRVQSYVHEAQKSADRYWSLARDAYRLGDSEQFQLIGSHYLRLRETITRWQRFLVKLEALELRRNEASATKDFLLSINELTTAINHGSSPQEIARMQLDMERAIEKSRSQEEMLDIAMQAAGTTLMSDNQDGSALLTELERSIRGSLPPSGTPAQFDRSRLTNRARDRLDDEIETALSKRETYGTPDQHYRGERALGSRSAGPKAGP